MEIVKFRFREKERLYETRGHSQRWKSMYGEFLKRRGYKGAFLIRFIAANGKRYTTGDSLLKNVSQAEICPFSKFFFCRCRVIFLTINSSL